MKAYGHTRTDKLECDYGCCTTKSGKRKNCRKIVDKSKRKKARQQVNDIVSHEIDVNLTTI